MNQYTTGAQRHMGVSMKKLIVGLLMAALASFGLVATTSTSAQAACTGGYSDCTPTTLQFKAIKQPRKGKVKFKFKVTAEDGAMPAGRITVTCFNLKYNTTYNYTFNYSGSNGFEKKSRLGFRSGKTVCIANYTPESSEYGTSANSDNVNPNGRNHFNKRNR
ncbi:hypothetical protein [Nocardioides acrostichi]|uniref:Uncharacterized protein n=1 Tax=Nocardioides acrostichi TaxID=2784339 RepID=A0A930V274_9ACTN|nr:hypothetical protein [Nocardioides acrostichi]MBF4162526.1 hypothetical protein [Nocardioides acrostichi]